MIFVTLGTQDKTFERLLVAIEKQIECGVIQEEVIVQGGYTHYLSKTLKMFDLVDMHQFNQWMDQADLIITHGGAGSIMTALKKGKRVIAAARLKQFQEHTNDHQVQLVDSFEKEGYLLALHDFSKLGEVIEASQHFIPKKVVSNTQNMIDLIEKFISEI